MPAVVLKGSKVLVTGGAGFIGSHLVDALLSRGAKVIVYDNFDEYYTRKEENIRHNFGNPSFKLLRADVLDYEVLSSCMKGVDVVFHLAAQPGVRYSMENPAKTSSVNVLGTLNVLRAAKEADVRRVVYASSSSVYGNPMYTPVDESHPLRPISIYGASKVAAELYCRVFHEQLGLPVVILRYFTVYGPRQRPDMAIYRWTEQMFEGRPLTIYGDGRQARDFTYVEDAVSATLRAAEVEGVDGEVLNVGGGRRVSVNEVVGILAKVAGAEVKLAYEPSRLGDVEATHADISKARRLLDFEPRTKLEDGLREFIKWYKAHRLQRPSGTEP
jgi:UDP-glucose 4-epimerase